MANIRNWISGQWSDVRGNFKWAVIYWLVVGSGLTWIAHVLQVALHANIAGWLSLAAPIFSILAVGYLLVIFMSGKGATASPVARNQGNRALPATTLASPPPSLSPSPPRPVDLRGEILELYFYKQPNFIGIARDHVLMKVHIVNHGSDEATITHCGLQVSLGAFHVDGKVVEIPSLWRIKRKRDGALLGVFYDETPINPCLGTQPDEIYKKGHPRDGWLNFEYYAHEDIEFPNAEFKVLLKDSLGGEHCIRRESCVYKKTGELVIASDPDRLKK